MTRVHWLQALSIAVSSNVLACASGTAQRADLASIRLPPGVSISMYADDVPGARSLALSPSGIVYVGTRDRGDGSVYAVVDEGRDGTADRVVTIARGLSQPNGVAWHHGSLYVAEFNRVIRYSAIDDFVSSGRGFDDVPLATVVRALPETDHHEWRYIGFGPDGKLYVGLGAPCNICDPQAPLAGIARMNPDGSDFEAFASGVRNTVGFDWHPETGALWFTDNGRDELGDDVPADELNAAGTPSAIRATSPIPSLATDSRARSSSLPPGSSARTSRRLGCGSTTARCFRPSTAAGSSSPSTDRGTGARKWATGWWRCAWRTAAR